MSLRRLWKELQRPEQDAQARARAHARRERAGGRARGGDGGGGVPLLRVLLAQLAQMTMNPHRRRSTAPVARPSVARRRPRFPPQASFGPIPLCWSLFVPTLFTPTLPHAGGAPPPSTDALDPLFPALDLASPLPPTTDPLFRAPTYYQEDPGRIRILPSAIFRHPTRYFVAYLFAIAIACTVYYASQSIGPSIPSLSIHPPFFSFLAFRPSLRFV